MKIKLVKTVGFNADELAKLCAATSLLEQVMNSPAFENDVRTHGFYTKEHWWSSKRWKTAFRMSNGKTNAAVFNCIMDGSEVLSPGVDKEADIELTIDRRDAGNVLGYTYASSRMQWIYSSFFGRATIADIASNLAHEYCHKLGFGHEYNYTADRQYTVPYGVGYIVKRIAERLVK